MDEKEILLTGGLGEGASKPSVSAPSKRLSRVDKLSAAVVSLSYALRAVGFYLDEGPLRSQTLEAASQALAFARSCQGTGHRHRANRDDARAVALQTRHGDEDDRREVDP